MNTVAEPLAIFDPIIREWFTARFGAPTDVQIRAWPRIASGEHVLITAPTGSGKTLSAFLWAIQRLITEPDELRHGRVLYVSPLRALNNDIRRNLEEPLAELRAAYSRRGARLPEIRVAVRSGDSLPAERRRMLRDPSEIFITTPESLNILLTSQSGRRSLTGFTTVILDEVHALAPTKRGVYLMTAVERLVRTCGEFQRIALSATVRPAAEIAQWVGGGRPIASRPAPDAGSGAAGRFMSGAASGAVSGAVSGAAPAVVARPVAIVHSPARKRYEIRICAPDPAARDADARWKAAAKDFLAILSRNRSTLFFCNSRRMAEKLTRLINEAAGRDVAYSHHGSLSREIREVVETRFKAGELGAIVATSSLELGIDIGSVDEVVLVETPPSVTATVQRIGRAGHQVGAAARGTFYPLHPRDLVSAAALAAQVAANEIEALHPVEKPLDVLAQVILSLAAHESHSLDDLFAEVRAAWPYRDLTRREFDLVTQMLAGRYAETRIRELRPRLALDAIDRKARAREGVATMLYTSGGVIPDRGYYQLRLADSRARVGELDEEFVWERRVGDVFPFGNRAWRIQRVTANDVEVAPASTRLGIVPFWRAEELNRSFHLSEQIALFLEEAESGLSGDEWTRRLRERGLDEAAIARLADYLSGQRIATGCPLPHRHHLVSEHFTDPAGTIDARQTVLHTLWGGPVNRPLALALAAAWEERFAYPLEVYANNDCLLINLPHELHLDQILDLVPPDKLHTLLRARLESSAFFGARFRENAQRALLLPRKSFRQRMPLWLNRLRSKKLLSAVARFEDFPILLETWRDCLLREFELGTLARLLEELRDGVIRVSEVHTIAGSPFAESIIWRQTNAVLYADDSAPASLRTSLTDELLAEVRRSPRLRPRLSDELITRFEARAQRLAEGYAPATAIDLLEWIKERIFVPSSEWARLLAATERDSGLEAEAVLSPIRDRIVVRDRAPLAGVYAVESQARIARVLAAASATRRRSAAKVALSDFLAEWLRFYGPVSLDFLRAALGFEEAHVIPCLEALAENDTILIDTFRTPAAPDAGTVPVAEARSLVDLRVLEVCDRENLDTLLRMRRAAQRPASETLPIDALPLFLALHQGLIRRESGFDPLRTRLEQLFGYPARAEQWEGEILPARLESYCSQWLDSLMAESDLVWFGCGRETIAFSPESDLDLFPYAPPGPHGDGAPAAPLAEDDSEIAAVAAGVKQLLIEKPGRFSFAELVTMTGVRSAALAAALWSLAWSGGATNDSFAAVRGGIQNRFRAADLRGADSERSGRRRFGRWRTTRPFAGNWRSLRRPEAPALDALDREELTKDRVRTLLARYGVLFRELLASELPELRWAAVFRTLRLMELSGEILTGRFFSSIPGVQFCSRAAFEELSRPLPEDAVFWLNATDPASPCGLGPPGKELGLPPRVATTHLVFVGRRLALVSRRSGREVDLHLVADHPRLPECLELFGHLLHRASRPRTHVIIDSINHEDAARSPYAAAFHAVGFQSDYKSLMLWKRRPA